MSVPSLEETAMTQTTTRKDILRRALPAAVALAGVCALLGACTDNPPKRQQMAADRATFLKYSSDPIDRVKRAEGISTRAMGPPAADLAPTRLDHPVDGTPVEASRAI